MNEWIGIGRLTRDPELSFTASNTARCVFTLAIDRPSRNGGEKEADFIRIVAWGRQGETAGQYLRKGSQCAVKGEIRTGSYKDKDGKTVYTTDVWANRVEFIGGRNSEGDNGGSFRPATKAQGDRLVSEVNKMVEDWNLPDSFSASEDDIPF